MKEATVPDLAANKAADTMTVARPVTPAVVSATWQRTAVKVKNATTVDVWATSAAIATKLPRLRSVIDASNPDISPVIVPTNQPRPTKF